jgi:hypothetical protein
MINTLITSEKYQTYDIKEIYDRNKRNQPLGCHNSEVNFTVGGLLG